MIERLYAWLANTDPDVLAAVADVDRARLREFAKLSPLERVEVGTRLKHTLERFRPR